MLNKLVIVITLFLINGCYSSRLTTLPINFLKYPSPTSNTEHLVVFLVGIGDKASAFERSGFFDKIQSFKFDSIVVDSHFGYYKEHSISQRIYEDILKPNREKYSKITILGISLGGYGAIKTASDYPEFVDNIILIAPFLGSKNSATKLAEIESLKTWHKIDDSNLGYFEDSWQLLHKIIIVQKTPIFLAFGESDKFALQSNQLAIYLDKNNVLRVKGGHNWRTWRNVWNKILNLKLI